MTTTDPNASFKNIRSTAGISPARRLTYACWVRLAAGTLAGLAGLSLAAAGVRAEPEVHRFDLTNLAKPELANPKIVMGPGRSPTGGTFSATQAYLTLDGKPFAITMGEFHPQRYPREYWEEAIMEMKAGGLNAIASYFFWNYVEVKPGSFDFSGNNDFRYFAELCRKHHILLSARIGPFVNGEILCGSMPPWLFGMPLVERSNDPLYLEYVGRWYAKLGEQLKGLYWKDGGPIFMVQVENEVGNAPNAWAMVYRYGAAEENRGPATKEEFIKYYQNLRQMALKAGIDPVYFTMTGWRALGIPDEFIFGLGGYMYLGKPGKENSGLTTIGGVVWANLAEGKPLIFIELGAAGSPARADWVARPPVESAISTALSRLGASDSITCGWYMYHGGTSPLHPVWGWGAKNETLSLMSYDYNAPLSEYGVPRPAYYDLRPFHQTLLNFAATFSDGAVVVEEPKVKSNEDRLRASVRMGAKDGGMVFLLHYGNVNPLSDRAAAIELKTPSGSLRLPSQGGIQLKNGDCALLPFNLDLGDDVKLLTSTAQLHSTIENDRETLIVCSSIRDQAAELVFALPAEAKLETSGQAATEDNRTVVSIKPGMAAHITITLAGGRRLIFAPLSGDMVRHAVEATIKGRKHYLISDEDIAVNGDRVRLTATVARDFHLLSYPELAWAEGVVEPKAGFFGRVKISVAPVEIKAEVQKTLPRKWVLKLPAQAFAGLNDIYADVDFDGLICRGFDPSTGLPVAEQLNDHQTKWQLGLKRFKSALAGQGVVLVVNANDGKSKSEAGADTMVLDEKRTGGGVAKLNGLTFRPEYLRWLTAK